MATTLSFHEMSAMLSIPVDLFSRGGRWRWFRSGNRASLTVVCDGEVEWAIIDATSQAGPTGSARINKENVVVLLEDDALTSLEQFGEAIALLEPVTD